MDKTPDEEEEANDMVTRPLAHLHSPIPGNDVGLQQTLEANVTVGSPLHTSTPQPQTEGQNPTPGNCSPGGGQRDEEEDEAHIKKQDCVQKFNVSPKVITMMRKIITKVVKYEVKIGEGEETRQLTDFFMELESRDVIRFYYDKIQNPMDLKTIRSKICAKNYPDLDGLQEDFFQMCTNAQTYYTQGSPMYADSIQLQNIFMIARKEVEEDYKDVKVKKTKTKTAAKANEAENGNSKAVEPGAEEEINLNPITFENIGNPFVPPTADTLPTLTSKLRISVSKRKIDTLPNIQASEFTKVFITEKIEGDGNCLFGSLSKVFTGVVCSAQFIREWLKNTLKKENPRHPSLPRLGKRAKYNDRTTWGGEDDLIDLAKRLNFNAYIWSVDVGLDYDNGYRVVYKNPPDVALFDVVLHFKGGHFEPLIFQKK